MGRETEDLKSPLLLGGGDLLGLRDGIDKETRRSDGGPFSLLSLYWRGASSNEDARIGKRGRFISPSSLDREGGLRTSGMERSVTESEDSSAQHESQREAEVDIVEEDPPNAKAASSRSSTSSSSQSVGDLSWPFDFVKS